MLLKKDVIKSMINEHYNKPTDAPLREAIIKIIEDSKHEYWDENAFTVISLSNSILYTIRPSGFLNTLKTLWDTQREQYIRACPYIFLSKQEIRNMLRAQRFYSQDKDTLLTSLDQEWYPDPMHYIDFMRLIDYTYIQDKENAQANWKKKQAEKEKLAADKAAHDMKLDKETISSMIMLALTHNPDAQLSLERALKERVFLDALTKTEFEIFLSSADYLYPKIDYDRNKKLQAKNDMMKAWEVQEKLYTEKLQADMEPPAYALEAGEEVKFHMEAFALQKPAQHPVQPAAAQLLAQSPSLESVLRDLESVVKTEADLNSVYALLDRLLPRIQENARAAQQSRTFTPALSSAQHQSAAAQPLDASDAQASLRRLNADLG